VEDEDAEWRHVPPPEVPREEPDISINSEFYAKIFSVLMSESEKGGAHMHYPVILSDRNWENSTSALIDSGATALFLSHEFVDKHHLERHKLDVEILVQNIDGTLNCRGTSTHYAKLKLKMREGKPEDQEFLITDIITLTLTGRRKPGI